MKRKFMGPQTGNTSTQRSVNEKNEWNALTSLFFLDSKESQTDTYRENLTSENFTQSQHFVLLSQLQKVENHWFVKLITNWP